MFVFRGVGNVAKTSDLSTGECWIEKSTAVKRRINIAAWSSKLS